MSLPPVVLAKALQYQQNEITEHYVYLELAKVVKKQHNKDILLKIAHDEGSHYAFRKQYTQQDIQANQRKIRKYYRIARIFGISFGLKLMEQGEHDAQLIYTQMYEHIPDIQQVIQDEKEHEEALLNIVDEDILKYIGSIVLGLNDALVELTGALAGFSLVFQNTQLIALTGLVMGIAASFSMAASEYLSHMSEGKTDIAVLSSLYTGLAYVSTVILLIVPFLVFSDYLLAMGMSLVMAVIIIAAFNYYLAIAKNYNFRKRFVEMFIISMGVALISFGVGYVMRTIFGIEM